MTLSQLHIALPAYNEASVLRGVIQELFEHGFENIIIVNDGSSDATLEIAQSMNVTILSHILNRGAGAASQTAIDYAKKKNIQYLLLMDADGQHHTSDILTLFKHIRENEYDIIIGNRFDLSVNEIPRIRIFFNQIANQLTNFFCKKSYSDSQSGFRILNRKAIENLNLKVDGYGFCSEMIIVGENIGLKIGEAPIKVSYTEYSMNKGQSFTNGISTAFNFMWRIIFN